MPRGDGERPNPTAEMEPPEIRERDEPGSNQRDEAIPEGRPIRTIMPPTKLGYNRDFEQMNYQYELSV